MKNTMYKMNISVKGFRYGEYVIRAIFLLIAAILFVFEVLIFLHHCNLVSTEFEKKLINIRGYFMISSLTVSYLTLTYNLYKFYRYDFNQNKRSMRIFFFTEFFIQSIKVLRTLFAFNTKDY